MRCVWSDDTRGGSAVTAARPLARPPRATDLCLINGATIMGKKEYPIISFTNEVHVHQRGFTRRRARARERHGGGGIGTLAGDAS